MCVCEVRPPGFTYFDPGKSFIKIVLRCKIYDHFNGDNDELEEDSILTDGEFQGLLRLKINVRTGPSRS